jgi:sterol desaturase/sphingolipid hydroxylase (fatty acid hydroxylase superfamily)
VTNYIALAVPVFFAMIGVESAVAKKRGVRVYRVADATTDLSCGIASQVAAAFWGAFQLGIYAMVYDHRVASPPAWVAWLVGFFGVDFMYYWWHRLSHEMNVLWAAHVVHHQSEDYNLAVALRQAVLTSWTAVAFYLPLAIIGVSPIVFATLYSFSTLYQFWIHTELVGKIRGPVEWVLNLPQHHRVHHATNPQYLDKNYAATLIVWDRLFGTFAAEEEPCVYGITKPLGSFSPLWAQVHYWFEMVEMAAKAEGFDKVRVFYKGPAFVPRGYEKPAVVRARGEDGKPQKFEAKSTRGTRRYVLAQYAALLAGTFVFMMWGPNTTMPVRAGAAALIVVTTASLAGLLEQKRWARGLEVFRLVGASLLGFLIYVTAVR